MISTTGREETSYFHFTAGEIKISKNYQSKGTSNLVAQPGVESRCLDLGLEHSPQQHTTVVRWSLKLGPVALSWGWVFLAIL